ncbi:hypothetical protein ACEPAH_9381 [Sanghuangporus vaninii]
MKYFAAVTTFIAVLLKGIVASVSRSDGLTLCPSAIVINSTSINVDGNDIQKMTFVCPDRSLSARSDTHTLLLASMPPIFGLNHTQELQQRSVGECRTSVPECQCGQTTFCSCNQVTPSAPVGDDCQTLIRSLQVIPEVDGPTFVVPAQGSQLLQFHTCAILWSNLMTSGPLEYCWDELSEIASLANQNCITQAVSTGGACDTIQHIWIMQ